jgi:hypothetical protein
LVDFYDFRVLKILKHLIIDVFSWSIQISQFSLIHHFVHILVKSL